MEDRDFLAKLLEKLQKLCIHIGTLEARIVQQEKSSSDSQTWRENWVQRCEQNREVIKASIRTETDGAKKELKNGVRDLKEDLEEEDEAAKTRVNGIQTGLEEKIANLGGELGDLRNKHTASRQILSSVEKSLGSHLREEKTDKRASTTTSIAIILAVIASISALINVFAFLMKL